MTDVQETLDQPQQARTFGIAQLFVVVAICAVALAFAFPSSGTPGQLRPNHFFWRMVFGLSSFTVSAFSMLGAALVIAKWIRERSFPREPGCLLFLFCASAILLNNLVTIVFASLLDERQLNNELQRVGYATGLLYVRCLVQVFLAVVCACGFPRNRWWWQVGFLCLSSSMLASFAVTVSKLALIGLGNSLTMHHNVHIASVVVACIAFVWLLVCCLIDLGRKLKRSRLHWFGILCFFVFSTLPTITGMVAMQYLTPRQLIGVE